MAGRYDEKVFKIWGKQGLSKAVQYYLFKKYKQKRYTFEIEEVYSIFKRYYKAGTSHREKDLEKMFKYDLEIDQRKQGLNTVFNFGNYDCKNVLYFSMTPKYEVV